MVASDALAFVAAQSQCSPPEAARFGKMLMGCYRARDFADAEVFATGVTRIFMEYPPGLCVVACDPLLGLPRTHTFPPAMKEIADWLEGEAGRLDYYRYRLGTVT